MGTPERIQIWKTFERITLLLLCDYCLRPFMSEFKTFFAFVSIQNPYNGSVFDNKPLMYNKETCTDTPEIQERLRTEDYIP